MQLDHEIDEIARFNEVDYPQPKDKPLKRVSLFPILRRMREINKL